MIDDQTLQTMVMDELDWEPSIDAAHIGVVARNGVVTLTGLVDSYASKAAAERAAARVQGVKAIAEEIEVRLPHDRKHADAEIADRALRILAWHTEVPAERIRVVVRHGVITLSGDVAFRFQREAAEVAVGRLGGVQAVSNMIRVAAIAPPEVDVAAIRERIGNALRRSAELDASGIQVSMDVSHVTLEGRVRTWIERRAAEDAAWAAPGVVEVTNHLVVYP